MSYHPNVAIKPSRGRTVKPGSSVADFSPDLAEQAHGWDPHLVAAHSNKKFAWKCFKGHIWESTANNRQKGNGCPFCAGRIATPGESDLATLFPEIATEAHGWDPSTISSQSNKSLEWKCPNGHIYTTQVTRRTKGRLCPECSRFRLRVGETDLATTHPDVAAEAWGWDPSTVTQGSKFLGTWKCAAGHVWQTPVHARTGKGRGCAVCKNQRLLVGFNDLATLSPELAAEAYGWDPRTEMAGSKHKVDWICSQGHIYAASLANKSRGKGCPTCSGKRVLAGFNDLATLRPDIAAEAHGWDPTSVTVSSKKKRKWVCKLQHTWDAEVYSRQNNGCPTCAGRTVLPGFNDLASANPELAAEAYGWDPTTKTKYSPKKMDWRCPLGHVYSAAINNRSGGKGCGYCAGQQVLVGFNDFASQMPHLAHEADGWDPSTVTKASGVRKPWKCDLGHRWRAPVSDRYIGQGCPSCAKSGFDPNKDGYVYFLDHDYWCMFQIGISNQPKKRLHDHELLGWRVLEVRGPMEGHLANDLETAMLRALKKRGAVFANKAGGERFDGWSEAWLSTSLPVSSISEILDFVYEDD